MDEESLKAIILHRHLIKMLVLQRNKIRLLTHLCRSSGQQLLTSVVESKQCRLVRLITESQQLYLENEDFRMLVQLCFDTVLTRDPKKHDLEVAAELAETMALSRKQKKKMVM